MRRVDANGTLAIAHGPRSALRPGTPRTLASALAARIARWPDGIIRTYSSDGEGRFQSYLELWRRSAAITTGLRDFGTHPGVPVVLLIEDAVDFVPAYWACIRGGFVAVPLMTAARAAFHPDRGGALREALDRLNNVVILADGTFAQLAARLGRDRGLNVMSLASAEARTAGYGEDGPPADPVYLVPTSGSSGRLKLVAVTNEAALHRSFTDECRTAQNSLGAFALDSVSTQAGVFTHHGSWTQLPAAIFTADPVSVLDAIARLRITTAALTNAMLKRIVAAAEQTGRSWDLGSLRQIGLGGDTIVPTVVRRLARFLEQQGASADIIRAGYGTTETGALVSGANPLDGPIDEHGTVCLGRCYLGVGLRIAGGDGEIATEGEIGEVQVSCPQKIFSCYWGEPDATRASFTADGWWRTGDLGRLQNGELSLHGRSKEILVVSGRKFSLSEIDAEIETVLAAGDRAFSCAIHWPGASSERLAVVFVAADVQGGYRAALAENIRRVVARQYGFRPDPVVAASPDDIPLAANGKLRRSELAARIRSGTIGTVEEPRHTRERISRSAPHAPADREAALQRIWRDVLDVRGELDRNAGFFEIGGDSLRSLQIFARVETELGLRIPAAAFFKVPTLGTLLRLADEAASQPALSDSSVSGTGPLIAVLEGAHSIGEMPALDFASAAQWATACFELWAAGRIDIVDHAVRPLHQRFPEVALLESIVALLDAMPRDLPAPLAFCDDPAADIQFVRRPSCDTVLLAFCAREGTLGLPLNFVHQWLGRLPVSIVYLKDFRNLLGGCGYPTLGSDRAAAVAALRRIVSDLGGKRTYTLGVSMGGYPALYYGLQLGAHGILNLSGATDLTPQFIASLGPALAEYLALLRLAPDYTQDLRNYYASADHTPRTLLAYAMGQPTDRQQAERMAGLPNVELVAVDCTEHNVVDRLVRRRQFMPLLHRLLACETCAA